ncbi:MAG TPA: carboxypeptidase-like regulatory domain-containing protein, partial [Flavobacterium sp.]|nr:carboxypeptidase-like regulatory domain-containing protein [Flavobacterium sp.]
MKFLFKVIACLFLSSTACAQQNTGTISGSVKTSDGNAAEYINISIIGSNRRAVTDSKGKFEIRNVKAGSCTLKISHLGLATKEILVLVSKDSTTNIPEIVLEENINILNEIVISSRKNYTREPTIAITRLGIKDIENPQVVQVISQELIKDKQI